MDLSFLALSFSAVAVSVVAAVGLAFGIALFYVIANWFLGDGVLHLPAEARVSYGPLDWLRNVWVSAPFLGVVAAILTFLYHAAVH